MLTFGCAHSCPPVRDPALSDPLPSWLQVVQQLRGIECTGQEKSTAWKMMMRQINKLPDKFHRRSAQVAANFSMHAFNSLTPSAQLEHSWTCEACPQDAQARELFGTAVLHGNPRGACLTVPMCTHVHCALVQGCHHRQMCGASRCVSHGENTVVVVGSCQDIFRTAIPKSVRRGAANLSQLPCCRWSGRPAKNKRGAERDREGGNNQPNGTDDDPLHDTPLSRVRIETSLDGWSKEVRICLVARTSIGAPFPPRGPGVGCALCASFLPVSLRYLSPQRISERQRPHSY